MIVKVPRIPKPGETILGDAFTQAAGGKGANQAVAAARSGGLVTFIGNLGKDSLGDQAIQAFKDDGIQTPFIFRDEEQPSGVALIFVGQNGENSIAVASGANGTLKPAHIELAEEAIKGADMVLMQLETPLETIVAAARLAKKHGVSVILNPAPAQPLPNELLAMVDIITPNETEAALLTDTPLNDQDSTRKAATKLLQSGAKTVIVTLGPHGALMMNKQEQKLIPGYHVDAVDTTAAGDTFNGVLAVALAQNKNLETAIRFAHAAAALSVTKMGAQPSIPDQQAIEAFLSK